MSQSGSERLSHIWQISKGGQGFCAAAEQSRAVWTATSSGISHAMSHRNRLEFGQWRGRTCDVTVS